MGSRLRVGTCSWKYPSWKGLVYSQAGGIDYLAEYARHFDTVEIDQWFWALPEPVTAAQYAAATPGDFRFTIKLPSMLTLTHFHPKKGEGGDTALRLNPDFLSVPLFEDVLARLEPLRPKIGMLMMQFEYLNARKMESLDMFLRLLDGFFAAAPRTLPIAVELRNPYWLNRRYFDFLSARGLSPVFLQGYFMPPIFETWRRFGRIVKDPVVVRLHGPDRDGIERQTGESWDRIVAPKDADLPRLLDMMRDMRDRSMTVYLNVNNHFEGSAPLTIGRLRERGLFDGDASVIVGQ
jgi:uncharacterized protein YecE (DUF72 family)